LAHRRLIKPLLSLEELDPAQIFSLRNKAPQISEEMLRVPDYYDDIDELTDEDEENIAEHDENNKNAQGSSTKKRALSEESEDDDDSSSCNTDSN